jgi:hypothetical protein
MNTLILDPRKITLGYLLRLDAVHKKKGVAFEIENVDGDKIKITKKDK